MRKSIVVLTTGGKALEIQMKNLPEVSEKIDYILIVDDRAEKHINAKGLKKMLKENDVKKKGYNVEVHCGTDIIEEARIQLNPKNVSFMQTWIKTVHCLEYWYCQACLGVERAFFIEDDVILLEGFESIFEEEKSMKYISMFNSGTIYQRKTFGNDLFFAVALSEIADTEVDDLLDTNINVGQVYFGDDANDFKWRLERMTRALFNSCLAESTLEFFKKKHGEKLPVSSFGNTFDERILGIIFYCCGISGGDLNDKVQIIVQDFKKVNWDKCKKFIKKNIVHVVMSSPKDDWWNKLAERGEIKA